MCSRLKLSNGFHDHVLWKFWNISPKEIQSSQIKRHNRSERICLCIFNSRLKVKILTETIVKHNFVTAYSHTSAQRVVHSYEDLPSKIPLVSSASSGCTLPEKPLSPVEWHVHLPSLFSWYSVIACGWMMSWRSRLSCPLMKLSISFTVRVLWINRWNAESARIWVIRVRLVRKMNTPLFAGKENNDGGRRRRSPLAS